ncbi:hypothetical protein GGI35DRAFT_345190 [Trichoderma velutinum]
MSGVEHRLSDEITPPGSYKDLKIKCYHSRRVPDPPDPRLQEIYDEPFMESSCQVSLAVKVTPKADAEEDESQVYVPAESETAVAFSFTSKSLYKVRMLVGGQNICSFARGEDDEETQIQDYFVTPLHSKIHGVFVKKDLVRQLVAIESEKPKYSIEHQMTGKDEHLNIQVQFFPEKLRLTNKFYITVCARSNLDTTVFLDEIDNDTTIDEIKKRLHHAIGLPHDLQRLIYGGKMLEDWKTLGDYAIQRAHVVHLVRRLRGGGGDDYGVTYPTPPPELVEPPTTIAPGGFISQKLTEDQIPGDWCGQPAYTMNLQVVNYEKFTSITRLHPKVPSPDEIAKISLRRCKIQQFKPSAVEEIHLRGIGEIHEESGIHINGPYDVKKPREEDNKQNPSLTWWQILFCSCLKN